MVLTYALRGFGYPLFAYGFLVWIAVSTPPKRLGSACGWFWFAYTGGLPTLGSLYASFAIPKIGAYNTLWTSLGLVVFGGLLALLFLRERTGMHRLAPPGLNPLATISTSLTILWRVPKVGMAAIIRAINTTAWVGFLVFMPIWFTTVIGFSLSEWLRLLSVISLTNIIWNLLFGIIGDKCGWRKTTAIGGGFGCMVTTLVFYYVPALTHDYSITIFAGALYGDAGRLHPAPGDSDVDSAAEQGCSDGSDQPGGGGVDLDRAGHRGHFPAARQCRGRHVDLRGALCLKRHYGTLLHEVTGGVGAGTERGDDRAVWHLGAHRLRDRRQPAGASAVPVQPGGRE